MVVVCLSEAQMYRYNHQTRIPKPISFHSNLVQKCLAFMNSNGRGNFGQLCLRVFIVAKATIAETRHRRVLLTLFERFVRGLRKLPPYDSPWLFEGLFVYLVLSMLKKELVKLYEAQKNKFSSFSLILSFMWQAKFLSH